MQITDLTPVEVGILSLIRAPDRNGQEWAPIPGRIHLVKELFAIQRTKLGEKLLPDLSFEPDNFGPFDETIVAALDDLEDGGFVRIVDTRTRGLITVTEEGRAVADEIWAKMNETAKSLVVYTKYKFNHLSSQDVLRQIYSAFPAMAKASQSPIAKELQQFTQ